MELFGMGIGEVLLVLVLALIIWGPKRLPEIAQTLGRTIRNLKKVTTDLTSEVTREIDRKENDTPSHRPNPNSIKPENEQK